VLNKEGVFKRALAEVNKRKECLIEFKTTTYVIEFDIPLKGRVFNAVEV
jgi:hypothetical protein